MFQLERKAKSQVHQRTNRTPLKLRLPPEVDLLYPEDVELGGLLEPGTWIEIHRTTPRTLLQTRGLHGNGAVGVEAQEGVELEDGES